jgi:hypothetical protein
MYKCPSAYVFRRYNIVAVEEAALPLRMTPPPVILICSGGLSTPAMETRSQRH